MEVDRNISKPTPCSRSIAHVADDILQIISKLKKATHASIVEALIKAENSGKKSLSLYDLLPENPATSQSALKRPNSVDIFSTEMKRVCDGDRRACSPLNTGFVMNSPLFHRGHVAQKSKAVELSRHSAPAQVVPNLPLNQENIEPTGRHYCLAPNKKINSAVPKNVTVRASSLDTQVAKKTTNVRKIDQPVRHNGLAVLPKQSKAPATVTSVQQPNSMQIQQQHVIPQARRTVHGNVALQRPGVEQALGKIENKVIEQRPATVAQLPLPLNLVAVENVQLGRQNLQHLNAVVGDNHGQMANDSANNGKVCEEIYQKLRAMFPDIKKNYIKQFCPRNWSEGIEHDVQFADIVDKVLLNEPHWEMDLQQQASTSNQGANEPVPNIDDTFEYLTGIFPNADPHFLRQAALGFKTSSAIDAFVDQKLKKPDYPTREEYLEKFKITQAQKCYTSDFIVSDFLKIFPDPFSHFEDPNRKCFYSLVASEFLKTTFNGLRATKIGRCYTQCHYNMSLTAKCLRQCQDFIKSHRVHREIPTEDISMLQEMAFIRHEAEIRQYIDATKVTEKLEFDLLKATGGLLHCQCCYDEEIMPSKCSTCDNGHVFCNFCIITGTDSRLGEGETHVPCFLNCGSEFSLSTLQNILAPTKFSILLKKRQAAEVEAAGLEGLVACPFCHFASIPAENDKIFKCFNPECMKESCIKCKEPNHVPLRCDEVSKQDKARKYIEEKMTQALARTCYKCKKSFFKEEGCNKITCTCGAMMCFICNEPVEDYSHFRGQGSNDPKKCPLWTDNLRLNAEIVRKVAENARDELLRADPSLNINTDNLTPALPPPTEGPHNDIPGAERLAGELAARVMKK